MRVFIPLIAMYGASFLLLSGLSAKINMKVAFYAAIFTSIMMAVFAATAYLLDQGFVGTQFFLPILAIGVLYGLYKLSAAMANNLKGK